MTEEKNDLARGMEFGREMGASNALFYVRLNELGDLPSQVIDAVFKIDQEDLTHKKVVDVVLKLIGDVRKQIKEKEKTHQDALDRL